MKLTKLEHAALILEVSGQKLFIDPGSFTAPLTDTAGAAAIVITHEHADHWTLEQLQRITEVNPGVPIYAPAGVASAVAVAVAADRSSPGSSGDRHRPGPVTVVTDGDSTNIGLFTLRFFGRTHAVIHESIPVVDNVGVLVNSQMYYAGDSFTMPHGVAVDVLAVPSGAPWLKISEVIDFVLAVKPRRTFPTHEMLLARAGKDLSNTRIRAATEQGGGVFLPLEPGDTLEL